MNSEDKFIFVLIVTLSAANLTFDEDSPVVTTTDGPLKGITLKSRGSRDYYAFRGIKYGNINGRFELAKQVEPWTDVKDATEFGSTCPQPGSGATESEDCLYLNVYVPTLPEKEKLPVMLWIHGGGWFSGAGSHFGANFFMDEDIILVTINYRLGALGFLSFDDGTVPANNGLKDMILSLKWVRRNIATFGGDPDKVTIFGESAGGASVHSLQLTPAAKGLFRGVIAQSGSALCHWAVASAAKPRALELAEKLGCVGETSAELIECLREQELQKLLVAQAEMTIHNGYVDLPFTPSMETATSETDEDDYVVYPVTPYELARSSDNNEEVSLMIGINEDEGILVAAGHLLANQTFMDELRENWPSLTSKFFGYEHYIPKSILRNFAEELRKIYFKDAKVSMETSRSLIKMYTDLYFGRCSRLSAELHAYRGGKAYSYVMTYSGNFSLTQIMGLEPQGPTHADELQYQFPSLLTPEKNWPDLTPESADEEFSKNLVRLWASFATDGEPTKTWGDAWEPVDFTALRSTNYPIMKLGTEARFAPESYEDFQRISTMDNLLSHFEKPQRSWRGSAFIRDEL